MSYCYICPKCGSHNPVPGFIAGQNSLWVIVVMNCTCGNDLRLTKATPCLTNHYTSPQPDHEIMAGYPDQVLADIEQSLKS